jgi:hypothetical protein
MKISRGLHFIEIALLVLTRFALSNGPVNSLSKKLGCMSQLRPRFVRLDLESRLIHRGM